MPKRRVLVCQFMAVSLLLMVPAATFAQGQLIISEVMAANTSTLQDEDGDYPDWIEIYNPGSAAVSLDGWYLADSGSRWRFPATNIQANAYLVVFASNKNRQIAGRPLHTNFRLSDSGEYLALLRPDGTTVVSAFDPRFPIQAPDVSYGTPATASQLTLVSTGTVGRLRVPNADLGQAWTQPSFDDSTWAPVENGIGFELDTEVAPPLTALADSVVDFSGNQGSNGWTYGYWDKKGDTDGIYATSEFVPFPRGTGNVLSTTNFWDGSKWHWAPPNNPPWTELTSTGGHPQGDNNEPLRPIHWAIRRYVAETNGPLRITGTLGCNSTAGTCGDGTVGHIFVDGVEVWSKAVAGDNTSYSVLVEASVGSLIDFAIDPGADNNDYCDTTLFTASIRQAAITTVLAASGDDWSDLGKQGFENWYYGYFVRTGGVTYGAARFTPFPSAGGPHSTANFWDGSAWNWFDGNPPFDRITRNTMRPSILATTTDKGAEHWVIRRWVSEITGSILIQWHVSKVATGGGGAVARLYQNNTQRDTFTMSGTDTTGSFRTVGPLQVVAGDTIDFTLEPGAEVMNDECFLNATIFGTGTLSNQFLTDISGLMHGVNASAMVRIPFTLPDALSIADVNLRVKADDGFIAYLNGNPVASYNAPETPAWNSTATQNVPDAESAQFRTFSLSRVRDFLLPGQNVLALQGLNSSASDPDFLLEAELTVGVLDIDPNARGYFQTPTPGMVNGPGSPRLGPLVTDIQHTPHDPADSEDLVVTARISPTLNPVGNVRLFYRVMYSNEVALTMVDDGTQGDGAAGDGLFGVRIPHTAARAGQMIRYYISAADQMTNITRQPVFNHPTFSAQYFGTVVADPSLTNPLPVLHLFITDANLASANGSSSGRYPASLYYLGDFYDNVGMNRHGQSSQGGDFLRKSYDIDFNPGGHFRYAPGSERVDDINLLATYADKAKMRNMLAYDTYKDAGSPYHFVVPIRMQHNGAYYADYHLVENGDADWLKRSGLDPRGSLYKMYNQFNDPVSDVLIAANSEAEKKTRKEEGNADLVELMNGVRRGSAGKETYVYDNINIPAVVNMLAAKIITADIDCCHKNYYLYRDTENTGEWEGMAWDVDLSFGRNWSACQNYWDEKMHPENGINTGDGNYFFEQFISSGNGIPGGRDMYLRRIRTLMDELLQPPNTPTNELKFEAQMDHWLNLMGPDAELEKTRWATWGLCASPSTCCTQSMAQAVNIMKTQFMNQRRTNMYSRAGNWAAIPTAQPSNVVIFINSVEYNPTNGNQLQEYIEIRNTNTIAVDISGWVLTNAVNFTFASGTVLPANKSAYVVPDKRSFRARTTGPRGGQRLFVLGPYGGQLSARGESIVLLNKAGSAVATNTYPGNPTPAQIGLRVTEIMYHPGTDLSGTQYEENYEYIELKNIGATPLNLTGVRFGDGIEFTFTGSAITNLAPGAYVLVVKNLAAFTSRYGTGLPVAGQYIGSLENSGEKIVLYDAAGEKIQDFAYDNRWYPITDGPGASLVIVNENAHWDSWGLKESWRPSAADSGSPAGADPTPTPFSPVLVNEVLTHTDLPMVDAIELWNPGTNAAAIGGWFISDDFTRPKKFRIPDGTTIPAGGYIVFDESQYNTNPTLPTSFSFSSAGDEAYLFSGNGTNLTGFYHGFEFNAADTGVSFGRMTNSIGAELFVAQSTNSLGGPNGPPRVGPVVISEIMYHPLETGEGDNGADEFIELHNITSEPVALYDPAAPTNTWKFTRAVDFIFPTGQVIPAGGYVVVTRIDPTDPVALARFRARYSLGESVPVYGPYEGRLDNSNDVVRLFKPDAPTPNQVPYVLVEEVAYTNLEPWPAEAGGVGPALQRSPVNSFGNEPESWVTALSPGVGLGGTAPVITTEPVDTVVIARRDVTLVAEVTGSAPLVMQWRFNSNNLAGANSATLVLTNVQPNQAGTYDLIVFNPAGSARTEAVELTVLIPPTIITQPRSVSVKPGLPLTLSVAAASTFPNPQYQWQRNGQNIPGATSNVYYVASAQFEDRGDYQVSVTDPVATEWSDIARVKILIDPLIVNQPQHQFVRVGQALQLAIGVTNTATLPVEYRLRRGTGYLTTNIVEATDHVFTIPNMQLTNAASYTVAVVNESKLGGILSAAAFITVVNPPTDQTAAAGQNATFNMAVGNPGGTRPLTMEYQWKFNGQPIPDATTNTLTISNITQNMYGTYSVDLTAYSTTNLIGTVTYSAQLSPPAADTDNDGMPDDWEESYACLNKQVADASADPDGDHMSNLAEYQAGTNPCDAQSYLKVELVRAEGVGTTNVVLRFGAMSNKTYSVLFQNALQTGTNWEKLQDVTSAPTNRTVELFNARPGVPARYYRLATPAQP